MANEVDIKVKVGFDDKGLKDANRKIGNFLKTGLKAGGVAAGAALATVGAAATVAATEAINFAEESNKAMESFRRQTGLSAESVEAFEESAQSLFALGIGTGINDIADAMAEVSNVMQTGAEDTEALTKRALVMRDVFDKDVGETIDAVKVLMDEFNISSDQAFDVLAGGIQRGLDRSGDFLDTIREYGNLFNDAGFSADQMFSIIETGTEGGVLGTDKIADAVKEMTIRMSEGGKDIAQGLAQLGLNADASFEQIVTGINKIEDPLERAQAQTAIFGTMAEDLGVSFTEGLDPAATTMGHLSGTMDDIVNKNQTIGQSMDTLKRQLVVALEPAAQELLPLLADGVSMVAEFLTAARPIFTGFAQDLRGTLGPALQIIGNSLARMGKVLGIVDDEASGLDVALKILKGTLDLIVTAIEAVAVVASGLATAFETIKAPFALLGGGKGASTQSMSGTMLGDLPSSGGTNFLGFQKGGVVPGSPVQRIPIMAHGKEEVANPNIGQAIVIGNERFAVREAARLARAINAMRQRDMQELVDTIAEVL